MKIIKSFCRCFTGRFSRKESREASGRWRQKLIIDVNSDLVVCGLVGGIIGSGS
jgi:hypothetical protein